MAGRASALRRRLIHVFREQCLFRHLVCINSFPNRLGVIGEVDWAQAVVDAIRVRAEERRGRHGAKPGRPGVGQAPRSMSFATAQVCP